MDWILATTITCDLLNAARAHVKQHAAIDDATPQLKETVQGEGGHVGFAPPLASIFHVFFKFQPPVRGRREAEEALILFEWFWNSRNEELRMQETVPDLAVSFHSASFPSFTQISSSSVNSSWATCSASSSVPRMNWTRWDGVSDERRHERCLKHASVFIQPTQYGRRHRPHVSHVPWDLIRAGQFFPGVFYVWAVLTISICVRPRPLSDTSLYLELYLLPHILGRNKTKWTVISNRPKKKSFFRGCRMCSTSSSDRPATVFTRSKGIIAETILMTRDQSWSKLI